MTEQPQPDDLRDTFILDPGRKQSSVDLARRSMAWFDVIEDWWGEPLTVEQADRIAGAPRDQFYRFTVDALDTTSSRLAKRALYEPPPPVPAGRLRVEARVEPTPPYAVNERWRGAQMLLYAHETLLVIPDFECLFMFCAGVADRAALRIALRQLAIIRPLVEQGIVHFAHDGQLATSGEQALKAELRVFNDDHREPRTLEVNRSVELAVRWPHLVTPLLHSPWAYDRAARILCEVWGQEGATTDSVRTRTASQIAGLRIPRFDQALMAEIVALRQFEEVFDAWRQALERALSLLPQPDGQPWGDEETALVVTELQPVIARMERDVKASAFLSRVRVGTTELVWGAIAGIPAAAMSGNLVTGLLTEAAGAGAAALARAAVDARTTSTESASRRGAIALVGAFRASD